MNRINGIIEVDEIQRLKDLLWNIKRGASKLKHGKSRNPRAAGEEIYGLADKADAALFNLIDPFSTARLAETRESQSPSTGG